MVGVVGTVVGGSVLYVLQRFLDAFKLDQNTKVDNLSSRVRTLETSSKEVNVALRENSGELGKLNAQIQVLASEQRHTSEAMKELRSNVREAETKIVDFGRVIRRES